MWCVCKTIEFFKGLPESFLGQSVHLDELSYQTKYKNDKQYDPLHQPLLGQIKGDHHHLGDKKANLRIKIKMTKEEAGRLLGKCRDEKGRLEFRDVALELAKIPSHRILEVAEMEAILHDHEIQIPSRDLIVALSEKFSQSAERAGKMIVQVKQVWNWFQNRRFALRSKLPRPHAKSTATAMPLDMAPVRNAPLGSQPQPAQLGRSSSENPQMEFEAKSARDGAWYDVQAFLSHRNIDKGDLEVRVRCAGFGADEDEWVNVTKHVRQRSLPCESTECFAVMPGDLILCFQEGKEQALYFDAHVLDAQRRRHDARGCRCRFLVRYDHDLTEEIVPLRKVCRRPETDYRLQQQHPTNESSPIVTQKANSASSAPTPKAANLNAPIDSNQKTTSNLITNVVPFPSPANSSAAPGTVSSEPKRAESVAQVTGATAAAPSEEAKQ